MKLSSIIAQFEAALLAQYSGRILPSHRHALAVMKRCRNRRSPRMLAHCARCDYQTTFPHSCGHRNCPHCQHFESQRWLLRQQQKQVPAPYFLVTFTLPAELRSLAWHQQRTLYANMIECGWKTIRTFALHDKQLQGTAGAIAVLHTHSRRLEYHPHVHWIVPAGAIDSKHRLWRTKGGNNKKAYLFPHRALAKVFRAKLLEAIHKIGLAIPRHPENWVVDCKAVGSGGKALVYLSRYLYRGVLQEKEIVACKEGNVTFRYQNAKTGKSELRTLPGAQFLWLLLQHVLPKGFRRTRNFGFLHPNSKTLIQLLQRITGLNPVRALVVLKKRPAILCPSCGGAMIIRATKLPPLSVSSDFILSGAT